MEVSITRAHKLTGIARSTIYKDIEEGKLSFSRNARGKKTLMVSELQRVYGSIDVDKMEGAKETSSNVADVQNRSAEPTSEQNDKVAVLMERINALEARLDDRDVIISDLKEQRQEKKQFYEDQIGILNQALDKAQDGYKSATKLLEDKSSERYDVRHELEKLKKRAVNEAKARQKAENELNQEKNKSFLEKLFA